MFIMHINNCYINVKGGGGEAGVGRWGGGRWGERVGRWGEGGLGEKKTSKATKQQNIIMNQMKNYS